MQEIKWIVFGCGVWIAMATMTAKAQDVATLMQEGRLLERKHKEDEALAKYQEVLVIQPTNQQAMLKVAELKGNIAGRETNAERRKEWLNQALEIAGQAWELDSTSADVLYHLGLAYRQLSEVEEKRDIAVAHMRRWHDLASQAHRADPSHSRAKHLLGCYHLEVVSQGTLRKASTRLLYGGLPPGDIKTAIALLEQCRDAEPYYCPVFLDLAKAYDFNRNYEKAVQTLEKLAKLPTRRQDDAAVKAEGKMLLQKLQ